MSAVDDAITEIDLALRVIGPQAEGVKDFARLNLKPETQTAVAAAQVVYDRRVGLLTSVRTKLERLRDDGYPTLATQAVTAIVRADLEENAATIAAALAQFVADPAQTLGLSASPPVAKGTP